MLLPIVLALAITPGSVAAGQAVTETSVCDIRHKGFSELHARVKVDAVVTWTDNGVALRDLRCPELLLNIGGDAAAADTSVATFHRTIHEIRDGGVSAQFIGKLLAKHHGQLELSLISVRQLTELSPPRRRAHNPSNHQIDTTSKNP